MEINRLPRLQTFEYRNKFGKPVCRVNFYLETMYTIDYDYISITKEGYNVFKFINIKTNEEFKINKVLISVYNSKMYLIKYKLKDDKTGLEEIRIPFDENIELKSIEITDSKHSIKKHGVEKINETKLDYYFKDTKELKDALLKIKKKYLQAVMNIK